MKRKPSEVSRVKLAQRCLSALAFLLFALCAYGQNGSITGTITDSSGAVAPNVTVEAKNSDTGVVFKGGTSNTGNYVISVPAGRYEVTAQATGFKKSVRPNVAVGTAVDSRLDVTLELGAISDTVTVNEQTSLLKTESGELAHALVTKDVTDLPVYTVGGNIRNPLQQIILVPGTTFQNENAIVVNGMPANSQSIRVEGQDATGNIWKIAQQNSQAGVEAIQEVAIQTSNFAAEYGQAAGGYFNYTMRSGTNQFHGSAYDILVNEGLNAGTPFTDRCQVDGKYCTSTDTRQHIRNRVRRSDYGFTLGGPVRIPKLYNGSNRTFFFFNFEQYRNSNFTSTGLITVPTTAYRNGNFSTALCGSYSGGGLDGLGGVCGPTTAITSAGKPAADPAGTTLVQGMIFDPYSTRQVNGQTVRNPYPNNTIPLTSLDPVAVAVQKLIPTANGPGIVNNYTIPSYSSFTHTTNFSLKFDQNLSSTIKLSGYYAHNENFTPLLTGLPGILGGTDADNTNHTTRVSYDQTLRPTLLLHVGIGYFQTRQPHVAPAFDQSTIGLKGYAANQIFPDIGGIGSFTNGGYVNGFTTGLGATFSAVAYEEKPTATTSLTWIHGNHTYKAGGEFTAEGYPVPSLWRANGNFTFAADQTADPWQSTLSGPTALNVPNPTGFGYASYLTGLPNTLALNQPTNAKLGYHSLGFYIQDSWKVSRKFTLDYGLRYDYQTYMTEQYGRMQNASFSTQDQLLGRNGAVLYGASCNCQFSHNYPFAFGPRIGGAYQIDSKTVIRGGAGIQYDVAEAPNGVLYSAADYYQINPNGYGISPLQNTANPAQNGLQGGNAYAVGNPFGNTPVIWPNLNQDKYPIYNNGLGAPSTPAIFIDPNNRPGRAFTWSIGIQREVMRNLVVEVSYVGNRGAFFPAPNLNQIASNALTPDYLKSKWNLDITNPTDAGLLTKLVNDPAVQARFPNFQLVALPSGALTVPSVYKGFPASQTLAQALRGVPQWGGVSPWIGPPMGKTWYDSMQAKVTKRYSHGFQADGNFTWAHAMVIGSASDSTFFLGQQASTIDIYNYNNNKQLNQYVRPLATTITFSYTTPKFESANRGLRVVSHLTRDWQIGAVLRYQSGLLIGMPTSLNGLTAQLGRGATAFGSSGTNYWNRTGQPLFLKDPNCGCFNPQTDLVLNKAAFSDAPAGQWTTSAPYYEGYRWQRQPGESMSFARNFRMGHEGRYTLQARMEFQNIFNRTFLSAPAITNPNATVTTTTYQGIALNNAGYGTIATLNGAGAIPRSGQAILRFSF
jgi:Carboxypeptidase regulatory-like domain